MKTRDVIVKITESMPISEKSVRWQIRRLQDMGEIGSTGRGSKGGELNNGEIMLLLFCLVYPFPNKDDLIKGFSE